MMLLIQEVEEGPKNDTEYIERRVNTKVGVEQEMRSRRKEICVCLSQQQCTLYSNVILY